MATALSMAAAAFLLTISFGYPLVGLLRRAGLTKQVRPEELPTHFAKTGTPTMGGLMFIGPIILTGHHRERHGQADSQFFGRTRCL